MSARVLVVDDLLPNVKLLEAKLNNEYYDVLTAQSGAAALEIVKTNPPDIILLDVMMPEMDGFEVCRRLKADLSVAHIPVVMVTALSEMESRVEGLKAGADDFLTKPINDVALFARIRSLVRLKIMTDELRLRDETSGQFGMSHEEDVIDTANATILVVDDDLIQGKQIKEKLLPFGHNVTLLSEPSETVETVLAGNYDLIMISTELSDMDGLRLCSHIRSQEKLRAIPLLILVEEDNTNILVKGLDMGVNDYLLTPVDGNELLARVNTQIRRKRYQDALKSNYQKSVAMSVTDGLTGLYNRRYFDAHYKALFGKALEAAKPLSLMMLDIDFFKSVNDTYGHVVGDEILQQVSQRIMHNVRLTDLVARYGGEEFVLVLADSDIFSSMEIGDRIRAAIEREPFKISAEEGQLAKTISIGVACLKPEDTMESLLKRADKALYAAKETGRNKVIAEE